MGCTESKPSNQISVLTANVKLSESIQRLQELTDQSAQASRMGSSASSSRTASAPNSADFKPTEQSQQIPNSLDEVPVSDLGESLDARRHMQLWKFKPPELVRSGGTIHEKKEGSYSAKSEESSDSGIYELDEDYSFVVTESSPAALVAKVESEFTPMDNLDLTVTGTACKRLLSGTQRIRQQETEILENLRQEGFISTSRQKSGGGLSFEIVEAYDASSAGSGKIKPKDFLPRIHEKHLDERRSKCTPASDAETKQALAEERRKLRLDSKIEKAIVVAGSNNYEKKMDELKMKKEKKADAAIEKRETHLRDLRDKLKAKNKKIQQVKLKKMINSAPCPVPDISYRQSTFEDDDTNFFN